MLNFGWQRLLTLRFAETCVLERNTTPQLPHTLTLGWTNSFGTNSFGEYAKLITCSL